MLLLLFQLVLVHEIQSHILTISTGILNTQTVISCGSSIDIYSSFDPVQVAICPFVSIDRKQIQLIYMNVSFDKKTNQINIDTNPPLKSLPNLLNKFANNSFITPYDLNPLSTYYLSFSSGLICRLSFFLNETICFYYSQISNFLHIEYQYDEIQNGSLNLSNQSKIYYYIVFTIIGIIVSIIIFFAISLVCTKEFSLRQPSTIEWIIDTRMAREEAAKRSAEAPPDGPNQPPLLPDELANRDTMINPGDG